MKHRQKIGEPRRDLNREILRYYSALLSAYGHQHWWPARSQFEIIVGALLIQNTAWRNAERALRNLRRAGKLSLRGIRDTPLPKLAALLRPAGYFRQKARRLKLFVNFLDTHHAGSPGKLLRPDPQVKDPSEGVAQLRLQLLSVNGVGPETADAILLYAGNFPVAVVDSYARRIFERHRLAPSHASYEHVRQLIEHALSGARFVPTAAAERGLGHPPSPMSRAQRTPLTQALNQFHALLVQAGKRHCHKSHPHCAGCPLQPFLPQKISRPLAQHRHLTE
jgi:endonuclease-3 related protein